MTTNPNPIDTIKETLLSDLGERDHSECGHTAETDDGHCVYSEAYALLEKLKLEREEMLKVLRNLTHLKPGKPKSGGGGLSVAAIQVKAWDLLEKI